MKLQREEFIQQYRRWVESFEWKLVLHVENRFRGSVRPESEKTF